MIRHASTLNNDEKDVLQARFALRVASHLERACADVSPDVRERLRISRQSALAHIPPAIAVPRLRPAFAGASAGQSFDLDVVSGGSDAWWRRFTAFAPLAVLLAGLFLIQHIDHQKTINAAAEVDAQLLLDELPPEAYSDPGFEAFLQSSGSGAEP